MLGWTCVCISEISNCARVTVCRELTTPQPAEKSTTEYRSELKLEPSWKREFHPVPDGSSKTMYVFNPM